MSDDVVVTKAQQVADQVNAAYDGEAPAYAARIAAKEIGAQEQTHRKSPYRQDMVRAFVFDDGSAIVIDGADWSAKDSYQKPKEPEPFKSSTIYVVLNENTLGYVQTPESRIMGVLHGSVLRGGHDWKNGGVFIDPLSDRLRPATEEDFDTYRVMLPPDFCPVTMEKLESYRVMSPILPESDDVPESDQEEPSPFRP